MTIALAGDTVDAGDFVGLDTHICMLQQVTTGQSIASGSDTALTFGTGTETIKTDSSWHSTSVNTSRITPDRAGTYEVIVRGVFAFNKTIGASGVFVSKNGTVYDRPGNIKHYNLSTTGTDPLTSNTASNAGSMTTYVTMNGTTDYLEAGILQVSIAAAAQTTNIAASGMSTFIVRYVGP